MNVKKDFDQKILVFIENFQNASLETHKLKGKYQNCLAFRLKNGYRVLFEFSGKDMVDLLDIGSHDIYKKTK